MRGRESDPASFLTAINLQWRISCPKNRRIKSLAYASRIKLRMILPKTPPRTMAMVQWTSRMMDRPRLQMISANDSAPGAMSARCDTSCHGGAGPATLEPRSDVKKAAYIASYRGGSVP
jgi:hypothetical protein